MLKSLKKKADKTPEAKNSSCKNVQCAQGLMEKSLLLTNPYFLNGHKDETLTMKYVLWSQPRLLFWIAVTPVTHIGGQGRSFIIQDAADMTC